MSEFSLGGKGSAVIAKCSFEQHMREREWGAHVPL